MSLPNCSPITTKSRKLAFKPSGGPSSPTSFKQAPAKVTGGHHLFAAFGYSLDGVRRLLRETAFRHELLMAIGNIALFAYAGARLPDYLVMVILMLALFAFEALNTAVEEIIDRISPEWSQTGRHAKNLGSFAVLCMLAANGVYTVYILIALLG
jgi:diacylglycerol kinase (ATP)